MPGKRTTSQIVYRSVPALRKRSYRRTKQKRRHHPARLSILTMAGLGGGLFASLSGKTGIIPSVIKSVKGEWGWDVTASNAIRETIGYDMSDKTWNLPALPLLTAGGALASKVVGKFVKPNSFDAIPYIGKKIKL